MRKRRSGRQAIVRSPQKTPQSASRVSKESRTTENMEFVALEAGQIDDTGQEKIQNDPLEVGAFTSEAELRFGFMPATANPADSTKDTLMQDLRAQSISDMMSQLSDINEFKATTQRQLETMQHQLDKQSQQLDNLLDMMTNLLAKQKQGMVPIRKDQSAVSTVMDDELFGFGEAGFSTEVSVTDTNTSTRASMAQSISDLMSQLSDINKFKETTQRHLEKQSQSLATTLAMMTNLLNQTTIYDRGKPLDIAYGIMC